MKIVATFQIPYYQYLDEQSNLADSLPVFANDPRILVELYQLMSLVRIFDNKAVALQRTGKMGTYPSTRGQEAFSVGMGRALQASDLFIPYYRDVGTLMQRGVKLSEILMYWSGDERANHYQCGGEDFPYTVPIASQCLHAAGAAAAIKIRQQKRAVLVSCGDGATSEGDFYEALNIAGVWHLPLVMVVNNNQWAISVPRQRQTHAVTIAQKAIAAGIESEQIDGNDVIAVEDRVRVALDKARNGKGPTMLEVLTYRHADHTTADDASRYEVTAVRLKAWEHEPIIRLRRYLEAQCLWSEAQEAALQQEVTRQTDVAVQEYLETPAPKPVDMFTHLYAKLPKLYQQQQEAYMSEQVNHD